MSSPQKSPWMVWGKRLLTLFFIILVPVLLYLLARNLEWNEVKQAILGYDTQTLLIGVLLVLASYVVFSLYDLLGRYYSRHKLPARQVIPVAMVCYAFNLNLTTWIGGVALRYRLYTRLGLSVSTVTRIISLGLLTNWTGYMTIAGVIFSLRLIQLPENWALGVTGLQMIGFLLLAVVSAYIGACAFAQQRVWYWREHSIALPSLRLALMQICLGATNWSLMAALIYWLLPADAFYPSILGVLLISCVASLVTHIPAGLGVLEAVFLALLQHQFSQGSIIAALLGYRALYFLMPLLIACVAYLVLEKRARALRTQHENRTPVAAGSPETDHRSEARQASSLFMRTGGHAMSKPLHLISYVLHNEPHTVRIESENDVLTPAQARAHLNSVHVFEWPNEFTEIQVTRIASPHKGASLPAHRLPR